MRKIKLKYKDTYIDDIIPGTSLYEVSKLVQKDFEYPILGAKLNHVTVDLNCPITENSTVEFLDRSSRVGNRIYSRSLEFLVIVAAKEVLNPKADVLINYSLDNGIYCEIVNQRVTKKHIEMLKKLITYLI